MTGLARRLAWLAIAALLPAAFMPGALNAFGPAKRDVFLVLALVQGGLLVTEGGWRARVRRLAGLPLCWPLAAAAAALSVPALARSTGTADAVAALETSLVGLLALALLAEPSPALGRKMLTAHAGGVALACVYALAQRLGLDPFVWQRGFAGGAPGSTYGNPLFLADGAGAALLWTLAGGARGASSALAGRAAAGGLFAAVLVLTRARGAWLGTLAGIAVLAWLSGGWGRIRRRPGWVAGIAAAILAATLAGGRNAASHFATTFDPARDEYRGRYLLWEATARMGVERPLAGWGAGQLRIRYTLYQARLLDRSRYRGIPYHSTSHAHQDALQWFAEGGVLAVGMIAWLGAAVMREGRRRGRGAAAARASTAILAAWAVDGCFNGPFHLAPSAVLAWLLAAITGRREEGGGPPSEAADGGDRRAVLVGALILLLARPYARDLVSEAYAQRTMFALQGGQPVEAVASGWRSFALALEDRRHRYLLGQAYRALGRLDDAAAEFAEDARSNPGFASAWRDLAETERDRGHHAEAAAALRRALELNPVDAEGRAMLAGLERPTRRFDRPEKR